MKRSSAITLSIVVFAFGCGLGYQLGHRKGLSAADSLIWSDQLERAQLNLEFEARAYLRCLQAIDAGDVANLHASAVGHVQRYVLDVQQAKQDGFDWAPHLPELYTNATNYLERRKSL